MISDIFPMMYMVVLIELVFGIGYDQLVKWAHEHNVWHVAVSVAIGVLVTLLIFFVFFFETKLPGWLFGLSLMVSVVCCGWPRAAGSMNRHFKDNKNKRPLGNAAARVRDFLKMDMQTLADDLAVKAKKNELTFADLADIVNKLHGFIRLLNTM